MFGGALAIAGFMAVTSFARDKSKGKGTCEQHAKSKSNKPQELFLEGEIDHESAKSLSSLLQHSTAQDGDVTCYWTPNMSVNQVTPSELLSGQTLILEKNTDQKLSNVDESPTSFHDQETAFSDHSHPESAASSNENGVAEEDVAQELDKDEPQDGLTSTETEEEEDDDDDIDDDEDDEIDMSDDGSEISEDDSSKGTGTLDYDDNSTSWPEEMIYESEKKLKGDYSDSHICSDSDADDSNYAAKNEGVRKVAKKPTLNEKANSSTKLEDQASVMNNWIVPMMLLAFLLFLILLNCYPHESLYVLDEGNSVMTP